jgi:hypothetical protein
MVLLTPSPTVAVLTTAILALVTMPTLRASTILFLLTVTLHSSLTPAVRPMHLVLPQLLMLLVALLPLSHTTDTTLAIVHHTGDTPVQLVSSQLGTLLPIPLRLRALSRRIVLQPRHLLVTLPPPSPPWSHSKCTNSQLWRLTCIPACLHLFKTRSSQHFLWRLPTHVFLHCLKIPFQCLFIMFQTPVFLGSARLAIL